MTLVAAGCSGPHDPLGPDEPAKSGDGSAVVFTFQDPRISESSGLAISRRHPGVYYTHNDKGNAPLVYAVSGDSGDTVAVLNLDTRPVDWEDIEVTRSGVWVGDIGDGDAERKSISVLMFPEPTVLEDGSPRATVYELAYEDGPHNAEALMVDPVTDQVYVVTKEPRGGGIYAAPRQLSSSGVNTLVRVGGAPPNVTAGSWSPGGAGFALRNYPRAFVYSGLGAGGPTVVTLPKTPQGESLALLSSGDMLIGSEGMRSQVLRVDFPRSS